MGVPAFHPPGDSLKFTDRLEDIPFRSASGRGTGTLWLCRHFFPGETGVQLHKIKSNVFFKTLWRTACRQPNALSLRAGHPYPSDHLWIFHLLCAGFNPGLQGEPPGDELDC